LIYEENFQMCVRLRRSWIVQNGLSTQYGGRIGRQNPVTESYVYNEGREEEEEEERKKERKEGRKKKKLTTTKRKEERREGSKESVNFVFYVCSRRGDIRHTPKNK